MVEAHPPRIQLPFALDRNPHAPDAECRLLDWVRRHEVCPSPDAEQRLIAARLSDLAAYTYPDADPELLGLYAQFIGWQYLVSERYADVVDERATLAWEHASAQVEPVYRSGRVEAGAGAMARALADILGRVYPSMSADWRDQFVDESLRTLHRVVLWSATGPRTGDDYVGGVDAYIRHRRLVGGQFPCLLLDEYMAGGELPAEIRHRARYDDIRNAAADVVSWTSDYYASRATVGATTDLVDVLAHHEHVGREHAETAVAARIQDRVADFLTARRELLGGGRSTTPPRKRNSCCAVV